ncbi:hypothetical protein M514_08690 [Trichuris suis]|uniref:Uncharacterized protein n=1 Tax=Trichuris suis TaxID=68888 RepID=A0A085MYQ5_9BILA|nr:hypothetical protein M513_08690 [Trichuris suis]KFD62351.1 hypothetical protein M514_08690 [Trichuris suis]
MSTLCDDFANIPRRQDGLGIVSLSQSMELGLLRLTAKMSTCEGSASRALAELWRTQSLRSKLSLRYNIQEVTLQGLSAVKGQVLQRHIDRFRRTYQGDGFQEFNARCSNKRLNGERWWQSFGRKSFGRQVIWPTVIWPTGRLADWSFGRQVVWPTGRSVDRSFDRLVVWPTGRLVDWSFGRLVFWTTGRLADTSLSLSG